MRRSYAPSKVSSTLSELHSDENRDPNTNTNTAQRLPSNEFRSPHLISKRSSGTSRHPAKRVCYKRLLSEEDDMEGEGGENVPQGARRASYSHELFIQQILKRPFKVPLEGYEGGSCRGLGMRRSGLRVALHDPYSDGALVLYYPPEQTAHDQIANHKDSNKTQVSAMCCPASGKFEFHLM